MKNPIRLLLVDDSATYSNMVQSLLQLEGRYAVDWVMNLEQMWEKLGAIHYAAVLLDNNLPDGTGLQVLPELTSKPAMPPVIMITGEGDETTASEAIKLGAYDYLRKGKPELIDLPHIVERALRMHADTLVKLETEEKLRYHALLLDRISDAVIVLDAEERVSYWNEGAGELFHVRAAEALGRTIRSILADSPEFHAFLDRGEDTQVLQLIIGSQKTVHVSVSSAEVWVPDQGKPGHVCIFRDITPYRLLQEELRKAQMQLLEAARVASVGELASSLAHQIHNPLTTVLGETQILLRDLTPDTPGFLSAKAIEEAGWRASQVIRHLMDLTAAAVESHDLFDLSPTILTAIDLVRPVLERFRIRLNLELEPGMPQVSVGERDLIDLWFHLINLATEYAGSAEEPWIYVSAHLRDKDIEVKIRCSGELPDPETVRRLDEVSEGQSVLMIIENILDKNEAVLSMNLNPGPEREIVVQINAGADG